MHCFGSYVFPPQIMIYSVLGVPGSSAADSAALWRMATWPAEGERTRREGPESWDSRVQIPRYVRHETCTSAHSAPHGMERWHRRPHFELTRNYSFFRTSHTNLHRIFITHTQCKQNKTHNILNSDHQQIIKQNRMFKNWHSYILEVIFSFYAYLIQKEG